MKLRQFIQLMHKVIGSDRTQPDYVLFITDLILRDPLTDEEDEAENSDKFNPLSGDSPSNLSKIYSGDRLIVKARAKTMMQRISKGKFAEELLYTTSDETKDYLAAELMKHGFAADASCVHEICALVFEGMINALADGKKELHPEDINCCLAVDEFEVPLLIEANCRCPLDRKPLLVTIRGQQKRRYRIVSIYPDGLNDVLAAEFNVVQPAPSQRELAENRIALCEDCADRYEIDPNPDTYRKLIEQKGEMARVVRLNALLRTLQLEDELREVVYRIKAIRDPKGLEEYDYDLLTLDEKIKPEHSVLRDNVEKSALTYYNFIKGLLHGNERVSGSSSDLIASQIRVCSSTLAKDLDDQDEIFAHVVSWVIEALGLGEKYRGACEILVSYYTQSCEVFHEAS